MTSEQLLDIIGLLDDGLIQEAERYSAQTRTARYRHWISLAACLSIVLALGYGATHMGMGGGGAAPHGSSGCAAESGPAASGPAANPPAYGNGIPNNSGQPGLTEPGAQGGAAAGSPDLPAPGSAADWLFAIRVDGVVYWATNEYIHLEPEEDDIRYTTSFINSAEPEEDGQANFLPVGRAYVALDNGTAAVYQEDTGSWQVYDSVPPWEQ